MYPHRALRRDVATENAALERTASERDTDRAHVVRDSATRMREQVIRVERTFASGPLKVWALVSDTNRLDRALGLAPASYHFRDTPDGRERVANASLFGVPVEWVEPPYQWLEGAFIEGVRRYSNGPVAGGRVRSEIFAVGPRESRVEVRFSLASRNPLMLVGGALAVPFFRRAIERYLDAMGRVLESTRDGDDSVEEGRNALLTSNESTLRGERAPVDEAELTRRAGEMASDPRVGDGVREKLLAWLRTAPDDDVESMRPYVLARRWGVARATALQVFLVATRAGVLDLRWKLLCPVCRTGADTARSLAEVGRKVRCDACDREYDVDFSDHVEAVFSPNAAVRVVAPKVWCASSAARRPHVFAQVSLDAGATMRFALTAYEGNLVARVAGDTNVTALPPSDPAPTRVTVVAGEESWPVVTDESGGTSKGTELVLVNRRDRRLTLQIERAGPPRDALTGSSLLLFPDYIDLFATDAPARGVELSVGQVALLFTDLTGSTALYERVGDARAFALVEQHFRDVTRIVIERGGTVVKTMGDAVMAAFPKLSDAAMAAVEMSRVTASSHEANGVSIKLGAHLCPCLAVRANERLDFFGSTVNLAARLQARAAPNELVLLESAARQPAVAEVLRGFPRRAFSAALKGIRAEQHLLAFDLRGARTSATSVVP